MFPRIPRVKLAARYDRWRTYKHINRILCSNICYIGTRLLILRKIRRYLMRVSRTCSNGIERNHACDCRCKVGDCIKQRANNKYRVCMYIYIYMYKYMCIHTNIYIMYVLQNYYVCIYIMYKCLDILPILYTNREQETHVHRLLFYSSYNPEELDKS